MPTGIWLSLSDLQNAATPAIVQALFDDANNGNTSTAAVTAIISRAEQEVLSWLVPEYGPGPISAPVMAQLAADQFLAGAALEYAVAEMYDRHPEMPQGVASGSARSWRFERADMRMKRILEGRQRPPTVVTPPANIGGVVVDNANRIYVDSPGQPGGSNAGDY